MNKSLVLIGASGLIETEVMQLCLKNASTSSVTILVRKPLKIKHSKLNEIVTDFSNFNPKFQEIH
jgi:hypothetical protein